MMNNQFRELILSIIIDNENYTDKELQQLFKMQNKTRKEILQYIANLYVEYADEGLLDLNLVQKQHIRKEFSDLCTDKGKLLATNEVAITTKILQDIAKETYYKIAYVIDNGVNIDKIKVIRQEHIDSIVHTKFKGEMYSSRIWHNKDNMIKVLKKELNRAMQGKTNLDVIASNIKKEFATKAFESKRLARTEMARVQNQANMEIAHNCNIEKVMYDATLDMKTCSDCGCYDGEIFDIDDNTKPKVPKHPNCRCTYINVVNGWKPSIKWDNENKKRINYTNYEQWKKEQNI